MSVIAELRPARSERTVDDIAGDIRQVHAAEIDLGRQAVTIHERLTHGAVDGDEVLDDAIAGAVGVDRVAEVVDLRARLDVLTPAIGAARTRRLELLAEWARHRAELARFEADTKTGEADLIDAEAAALLAAVAELQGCEFGPIHPLHPVTRARSADPLRTRSELLRVDAELLCTEAKRLDGSAAGLEAGRFDRQQLVHRGGSAHGSSVADLVDAVAALDPFTEFGPRIDEVGAWAVARSAELHAEIDREARKPGPWYGAHLELAATWSNAGQGAAVADRMVARLVVHEGPTLEEREIARKAAREEQNRHLAARVAKDEQRRLGAPPGATTTSIAAADKARRAAIASGELEPARPNPGAGFGAGFASGSWR